MLKRRKRYSPPNPVFYLSNSRVNVRFSYLGIRLSISTHETVTPDEWDANKQRPKSKIRARQDLVLMRDRLNKWEDAIRDVYRDTEGKLSAEDFKQEVLVKVGVLELPEDSPKELLPYLEGMIEDRKKRAGKTRTSWGKFESLHRRLIEFSEETKTKVDFNHIDWNFKDSFTNWLYQPPRSYSQNNTAKMFSVLRQVMRDAFRRKVSTNTIFDDRAFMVKRVKTRNKIRLTVDELSKLEKYDFSDNKNFDFARDLMVFACWTGLRISDWYKVGRANIRTIEGGDYIELATSKTKGIVLIPMAPQVLTILDKYDYKFPEITDQYFNRVIKEVCREVLPEATFTRVYSEAGQTKEEQALKSDYISSHAGRRSFATNMYEAHGNAAAIMMITGHESEATFFSYIDLDRQKAVTALRETVIQLARKNE